MYGVRPVIFSVFSITSVLESVSVLMPVPEPVSMLVAVTLSSQIVSVAVLRSSNTLSVYKFRRSTGCETSFSINRWICFVWDIDNANGGIFCVAFKKFTSSRGNIVLISLSSVLIMFEKIGWL